VGVVVGVRPDTPKIQFGVSGVSDTPKILVYLVTSNCSSSSLNLFNTAVTTHKRNFFYLNMHQNRLTAGLYSGPLRELKALL